MTTPALPLRERLLPSWWAWVAAAALVAMIGVAYGAALGATAGWLVGLAGGILAGWLLVITSPVVSVNEAGIVAAGARLPGWAVADVISLDRQGVRDLRGPGADARIFAVLRPWSAPGAVLVTLKDDDDPHPAWLLSSRDPDRLMQAITATMEAQDRL